MSTVSNRPVSYMPNKKKKVKNGSVELLKNRVREIFTKPGISDLLTLEFSPWPRHLAAVSSLVNYFPVANLLAKKIRKSSDSRASAATDAIRSALSFQTC